MIRQVAARGYNLLLDQFASFDTVAERIAIFKAEVEKRGRVFDPKDVGVARAFYVAKDDADKEAALQRRIEAQRRLEAISSAPGAKNTASIMAFSDTREASEESALYGKPDEIAVKLTICASWCRICVAQRRRPRSPRQPAPLRPRADAGIRRSAKMRRSGSSHPPCGRWVGVEWPFAAPTSVLPSGSPPLRPKGREQSYYRRGRVA